jgi:predicted AAA+ superfamily ATPase
VKYIQLARGSGKPGLVLETIKDEIKKGDRLVMINEQSICSINKELDKLRKRKKTKLVIKLRCLKQKRLLS